MINLKWRSQKKTYVNIVNIVNQNVYVQNVLWTIKLSVRKYVIYNFLLYIFFSLNEYDKTSVNLHEWSNRLIFM